MAVALVRYNIYLTYVPGNAQMNTEIDRVWSRIKETARAYADAGRSITYHRARTLVAEFVREECVDNPRAEPLDFFANELIDHLAEYKAAQQSLR
jgi:hypothetical protein